MNGESGNLDKEFADSLSLLCNCGLTTAKLCKCTDAQKAKSQPTIPKLKPTTKDGDSTKLS